MVGIVKERGYYADNTFVTGDQLRMLQQITHGRRIRDPVIEHSREPIPDQTMRRFYVVQIERGRNRVNRHLDTCVHCRLYTVQYVLEMLLADHLVVDRTQRPMKGDHYMIEAAFDETVHEIPVAEPPAVGKELNP